MRTPIPDACVSDGAGGARAVAVLDYDAGARERPQRAFVDGREEEECSQLKRGKGGEGKAANREGGRKVERID